MLYVYEINTNINIQQRFENERESVLDVEMNTIDAEKVIAYLRERILTDTGGAIRIQFIGRMVI